MPSYVGIIFIDECKATITIGDGNKLTPKTVRTTVSGAGTFDIGDLARIVNKQNKTEVIDNDVIDQGFILNL